MLPRNRLPRPTVAVIAVAALALIAASATATFRAEDWLAMDLGDAAFSPRWREVWTTLWYDGFYRPLTDCYQALMFRVSGGRPWPYYLALILAFGFHTWLLARIARLRGADRDTAWLAAAAGWAQVNLYVWTALWMSNAGGSLAATFVLLALYFHHHAVRRAGVGGGATGSIVAVMFAVALGFLCKEETVMLPVVIAWLEAVRWRRLGAAERQTVLVSVAGVALMDVIYVLFRLNFPELRETVQLLAFGRNLPINFALYVAHLGALPVVAALWSRWKYPAAWRREARQDESWRIARGEILAGLGWAFLSFLIFLPIPWIGYGYLYGPSFGVALAVGNGLRWAAATQANSQRPEARRRAPPATVLAIHWALLACVVAGGLVSRGWLRYGEVTNNLFAAIDRAFPTLPQRAWIVFVDPNQRETSSGRSLFNMVFDATVANAIHFHYRRPDLIATLSHDFETVRGFRDPNPPDLVLLIRGGVPEPVPLDSVWWTHRVGSRAPTATSP